jgi:2,4-dienoyl-CoA reductase-like NADH-dependent reductase (Old Yellow Enzyme family)
MAKKFRLLCSPFQIKQMRLRNRMVKTGSAMNMSTEDGFITDADVGFYEAIAKGGAGLRLPDQCTSDGRIDRLQLTLLLEGVVKK